ncbi:MAG: DsbA family protein, partial [Gaiellales bacterium]
MTAPISATLFSDPGCPFGYSANPALRALEWRYRDQLDWQLVMIGLAEDASSYEEKGHTPAMLARFNAKMR